MSQNLLTLTNRHLASCGTPIGWSNEDDRYYGYFANAYGDQWVFVYDRTAQVGHLYGGDIGWDAAEPVLDGKTPHVFLSPMEAQWLMACWQAATER